MYICLCYAVTDTQLKDCAADGCSLTELKDKLNVTKCCGSCSEEVDQIYNQVRNQIVSN